MSTSESGRLACSDLPSRQRPGDLARSWDEETEAHSLETRDLAHWQSHAASMAPAPLSGAATTHETIDGGNFYASKDNEYPTLDGSTRRINWGWATVPPASTQTLPREITFNAAARTLEQALATYAAYGGALNTSAQPVEKPAESEHVATEWELNNPAPAPQPKAPMAPVISPAVVEWARLIPKRGGMFGGSEVAQRHVAAAGVVVDAVVGAVGAANAQEAVEKIAADPVAREAANKAVESVWYQITTEAGGGGIKGAGERDAAAQATGSIRKSASFWIALLLLPLVYLLVLSLIGLVGTATWSDDVRAGLAGSLISAIVGGLVGYYYGQTTSRNRGAQ